MHGWWFVVAFGRQNLVIAQRNHAMNDKTSPLACNLRKELSLPSARDKELEQAPGIVHAVSGIRQHAGH